MPVLSNQPPQEDRMPALADAVDFVVGVDTHKNSHTAAIVLPTGAECAQLTVATDAFGYKRLLAFAKDQAGGRRSWAIEGTGSFGAGLTTYLLEQGEWVVEIDRPKRPARRNGAKSDELDAVRAAREALSREHLAQPRRRGDREAMRVLATTRHGAVVARTKAICHLKALVVNAPEPLRNALRNLVTDDLVTKAAGLRTSPTQTVEHRATVMALRATARRIQVLDAEASDLESQLELLVKAAARFDTQFWPHLRAKRYSELAPPLGTLQPHSRRRSRRGTWGEASASKGGVVRADPPGPRPAQVGRSTPGQGASLPPP